jgi:hypothetical protein
MNKLRWTEGSAQAVLLQSDVGVGWRGAERLSGRLYIVRYAALTTRIARINNPAVFTLFGMPL